MRTSIQGRARRSGLGALALAGVFSAAQGCSAPPPGAPAAPDAGAATWSCPAGWVQGDRGGCGPAALLCGPEGGAAAGACAGVDAGGRSPDDPMGPPGEAWSPDAGIGTCAEAWRRLDDGTCDPALRTDCPAGSAALPGGACTPTSEADCPTTRFAALGPEAAGAQVLRVSPGSDPAVADGSEARPYATIAAAIRASSPGAWILLAAGEYPESLPFRGGPLHLVGVCAARVVIRGVSAAGVVATGRGTEFELRAMTVSGDVPGLVATSGGHLIGRGLVVAGTVLSAVASTGAGSLIELSQSVVRGTRARADGQGGRGLDVSNGAALRATGVVVEDQLEDGLAVYGRGSQADLTGCVIRGTRTRMGARASRGLRAEERGTVRATGVLVEGIPGIGVLAGGPGSAIELARSVVRRCRSFPGPVDSGHGVIVAGGASVRVEDTLIDDNVSQGVIAADADTRLTLTASVVRGTNPVPSGGFGRGVEAAVGARIDAVGVIVERNTDVGVSASGAGTVVELTDSVVRGTRASPSGWYGRGLVARAGGTLRATRTLVVENTEAGAVSESEGSRLELAASAVRSTRSHPDGRWGHGIEVQLGGALYATGVSVTDSGEGGIVVVGAGSSADLEACEVRRTRPWPSGALGRGLEVNGGASLRATGLLVADNTEFGIGVFHPGTTATLTDVLISRVAPSSRGFGLGLYAGVGARVDVSRVAVQYVAGAAVAAVTPDGGGETRVAGADVFVRGVQQSTVEFSGGVTATPEGMVVAYGLHAGPGSAVALARATVVGGGQGFFNAGSLNVRQGLIAQQREIAGAYRRGLAPDATQLIDVTLRENADQTVDARDLPSAGYLEPSRAACETGECE